MRLPNSQHHLFAIVRLSGPDYPLCYGRPLYGTAADAEEAGRREDAEAPAKIGRPHPAPFVGVVEVEVVPVAWAVGPAVVEVDTRAGSMCGECKAFATPPDSPIQHETSCSKGS